MTRIPVLVCLFFFSLPLFSQCPSPSSNTHQDYCVDLTVEGFARDYFVHLPSQYDSEKVYPVVIVLHGGLRNAADTIRSLGWNQKADAERFIVVYPEGRPLKGGHSTEHLVWYVQPTFYTDKVDETAFLGAVLDDLTATLPVDPARIFATGISNGAMLTYQLGCQLSHRIAAIASVAGALDTPNCAPTRPLPVLDIHGTADKLVPMKGDPRQGIASAQYTVSSWLAFDGCSPNGIRADLPIQVDDGTRVWQEDFADCDANAEVKLYRVEGGGHEWPGAPNVYPYLLGAKVEAPLGYLFESWLLGTVTENLNADAVIWQFFEEHPLP